jgi:hypothetical protein
MITTMPKQTRAALSAYRVRITALDKYGYPWDGSTTGRGAMGLNVASADGDKAAIDLEPLFPLTQRNAFLRMHVRTHCGPGGMPLRTGPGQYACELFEPRSGEWSYALFPRVAGNLTAFKDLDGVVLALSGTTMTNVNAGDLTTGFRHITIPPTATALWLPGYTGDVPEVTP